MAKLFTVKNSKKDSQLHRDAQFNKLIKKWKRKFSDFGIREELTDRKEFVKPSLQKRKQMQEAVRKNNRLEQFYKEENGR